MSIKRILAVVVVLALVLASVWAGFFYYDWKTTRVSFADPLALEALEEDDAVEVSVDDWIVFRPRGSNPRAGFIFYPGGECEAAGYAEPLHEIARAGFLVVLVPMPFYLAVLAPDRAESVIEAFPEIQQWAIGGHSLGGAMAARFAYRHPRRIDGLLLWDAYPPDTDDLSTRSLSVILIHRADDTGAMPDYYEKYLPLLPRHTQYSPVVGASHINFGRFRPARRFLDAPPATIPIGVQHHQIAAASINFLRGLPDEVN